MKNHRKISLHTFTVYARRPATLSLALVLLLLVPVTAHAERYRYVLDLDNARIHNSRGRDTVLTLKRELHRQYPDLDVSGLKLKKVVLVAKSRKGHGKAKLLVGSRISGPYRITGRAARFHSHSRDTYDRIEIRAPGRKSKGPWQLHLQGKIKAKKVTLVVEDRRHRPLQMYGWWSCRRR